MLARLTLLGWLWAGQWRAHPGRAVTAVLAIAIGVALALAIHLVNRSALDEFGAAIAVVNGDAQAQLKAAAGGFDEALYPRVAQDRRIQAASPVVETEVVVLSPPPAPGARATTLRVIGLDVMRAAAVTPSLIPAAGTVAGKDPASGSSSALFADDAIFLSTAALQALGLRVGDRVRVQAGPQAADLRVMGTLPGAASGQRLAVMDIGAAQWRLGWLGRLSRIDLRLAPGVDPTALAKALEAVLPPDVRFAATDSSRQRMSNLSRAYRVNLNVLALVALFTGGFIVYATMALAVVRQLPELALLGVLGASRRWLAAEVLGQGVALGSVGAAIGVLAGFGLAAAMLALVGGDLGGGYFQGSRPALSLDAPAVALFAAMGIAVGLAGSVVPAWSLRALAPARALRSGVAESTMRRRHGALWSGLLFALGAALLAAPPVAGLPLPAYLAILVWLLAGIVFVPLVTRALGASLARTGRFVWKRPSLWLAVHRIHGAPGSAAAALSGVVASVALASAMAIMVHSFRDSVEHWLDTVLPADLYGRAPSGAADGGLTVDAQRALAALPGVARADFMRAVDLVLDPARPPVVLLARELDPARVARQLPVTGEVLPAPAGTIPIYVSEAMVDLYGFTPGKRVTLPIPAKALGGPDEGPSKAFFVAAVWRDYARQHGAISIALADWRRISGDSSANNAGLWLAPGTEPETVVARIREQLPALAATDFSSAREIRQLSLRIFDRSFALTYVLEGVAIVVGLFGVMATYAGEALARAREFGMLRHLGVTRAGIARMFALESAILIVTGVAWGAGLGVLIAMVLIHRVNPQSFHWTMDVAWPTGLLAGSAAALIGLGILSAVLASRSATGAAPVRAVREDW